MADTEGMPSFGAELKDSFRPTSAWVGHGIAWLDDIQQFYRERSAIEKDYAARLNALAKRYYEKKTKKAASLTVGDSPTMTPGSLECASLTTWSTQLTTLERRAAEHDRFGTDLVTQLADPLKTFAARFEEMRRRHGEQADRLEKERDGAYSDLRKTKARYDAACQEVESRRKKSETASDKARAQSAYQQQLLEMNNAKNTYLIGIRATNRHKELYYSESIPDLMTSLQDLSEFRTARLNRIWALAARLEGDMLAAGRADTDRLGHEIERNLPHLDSLMYVRHNSTEPFEVPADKRFEPSPVWHDEDAMAVDESAKVYLRNVLNKSKGQLGELRREVDRKRREVEAADRAQKEIRARLAAAAGREANPTGISTDRDLDMDRDKDRDKGDDEMEISKRLFTLQEELHQLERRRVTAEIETATITAAVGDVTLGAKNHNFKAQTFKIPTNCDLCGERIWGLSAKGFDCRDCGYACHSKCEMKVPAECPGEQSKDERKRLKAERQEAANALLKAPVTVPDHVSGMATGALSRSNTTSSSLTVPTEAAATSSVSSSRLSLAMASRPDSAGSATTEDRPRSTDGPGGPLVSPGDARPTAAPALTSGSVRKPRLMAPPPTGYVGATNGEGGSPERKGKMMYGFEASAAGEITVPADRDVVMLEPDDGTGWVKIRAGYKEGIVPSTYVEWGTTTTTTTAIAAAAAPVAQHNTGASPSAPAGTSRPESVYSNSGSSIGGGGAGAAVAAAAAKRKGPAVAPRRGARQLRHVEALYEYTAQSETEHSMGVGERFVLVRDDPGDGWVEVEKGGATRSVPAAYVKPV